MILRIDTYENNDSEPILTHVFRGKTRADIDAVIAAHAKYDAFFRASITSGKFQGIRLTNRYRQGS